MTARSVLSVSSYLWSYLCGWHSFLFCFVILTSAIHGLHHALDGFVTECEVAEMKFSFLKLKLHFSTGKKNLPLGWQWVSIKCRMEQEINCCLVCSNEVVGLVYCGEVRVKPKGNSLNLLDWTAFTPTSTCGHEVWIVTKRMRYRIQAAEIGFFCRVSELT